MRYRQIKIVSVVLFALTAALFLIGCGPTTTTLNIPRPEPDPPRELMLAKMGEEVSAIIGRADLLAEADALYEKAKASGDPETYLEARDKYDAAGAYNRAAEISLEYGKLADTVANEARARIDAARLYQKGAEYKKSAKIFRELSRHKTYSKLGYTVPGEYKTYGEVSLFQLGFTYELMGEWKDALKAYQQFSDDYADRIVPRINANYRLGWVARYLGDDEVSQAGFTESYEIYDSASMLMKEKMEDIRPIALNGRFQSLEFDYYEFDALPLELPQKTMEANLLRRMELSQGLLAEYTDFVGDTYDDEVEWKFISVLRSGDVYYDFARALEAAELPEEIDPARWEKLDMNDPKRLDAENKYNNYMDELDAQVVPLDEQALEHYRLAISLMEQYNLEGPWADRARAMLGELDE
ncbi:MAG: hypothetical protein GY771_07925 [bacterium]|nr:hypothetical protein [bacterium]